MTLSDPRALADFADLLKIASVTWDVQRNDQVDGLGSADPLVGELASPLWLPKITVDWMVYPEARRIEARLNSLTPLRQFYLCDPIAQYPANDPAGTLLAGHNITISSIGADNSSIAFAGFPANFPLVEGDKFHVDFSNTPIRRAVFEISEPGNASGAGVTPVLAVFPHVWTGITAGLAVTFLRPALKCILLPGSITRTQRSGTKAAGLVFSALQRL